MSPTVLVLGMNVPTAIEIAHIFLDMWREKDPALDDCQGTWICREPGTNVGTWIYVEGTIDRDYLMSFCLTVTDQHEDRPTSRDHLFVWVEHSDVRVAWANIPSGDPYAVLRRWVGWTEACEEDYMERRT